MFGVMGARFLVPMILTSLAGAGASLAIDSSKPEPDTVEAVSLPVVSDILHNPAKQITLPKRYKNYDDGSCAHATAATLLYHAGYTDLAAFYRDNRSGAESLSDVVCELNGANVETKFTSDEAVVKAQVRSGTPVAYRSPPGWFVKHVRVVVMWDKGSVKYWDCNYPDKIYTVSEKRWQSQWSSGGNEAFYIVSRKQISE